MIAAQCFGAPQQRIHLRAGELHVEIWPEAGGAVARFERNAAIGAPQPLFRSTPAQQRYSPLELACFPLLPYSNRIRDGRFGFGGAQYCLPRNRPDVAHPLHGVGWLSAWTIAAVEADACELSLHYLAGAGWPFEFRATQRFRLTQAALVIDMTLQNLAATTMPCGLGQHPYFPRPPGTRLRADVSGVWRADADMLPLERVPLPTEWDLVRDCPLDGTFIDNCFDGFTGAATVRWPDGSGLAIEAAAPLDFLVVYNPPAQDYFCVEPVTQLSDGFNIAARPALSAAATGLRTLRSGESLSARHSFRYLANAASPV